MVGQGALRECLAAADVEQVISVVRRASGQTHPKLREIVRSDVSDLDAVDAELATCDACLFCLGVSSFRMSEADYSRLTYDLTMSIAQRLARVAPGMTFIYVSGASTDSTERGNTMWARVKGRTENAILALPFRAAYMFRPGAIIPMHGIRSRTAIYNRLYAIIGWTLPMLQRLAPNFVTTTEEVGRAMLHVARNGWPTKLLEMPDIRVAGQAG